ncbi:MAG: hypothetical protein IPF68_11235 [Bacteroidales bacterium]|nr:hypothetical protein [Bacteroidales bacterium]
MDKTMPDGFHDRKPPDETGRSLGFGQPWHCLKQNPSPLVEAVYFPKFAFNNASIIYHSMTR